MTFKTGFVFVLLAQQFWLVAVSAQSLNNDPPPMVKTVTPPPTIRTVDTSKAPTQITLSPNGKTILIAGLIEPGAANRFKIILDAVPSVENVSLMSQGGRLNEASEIYQAVKNRGLDTYVDRFCMSACTMVFLGGRERSATPQAKVGFHQPYFTADKSLPNAAIVASMRRFYDEANVRPSFTDKSMKTPSSDMWYPSFDELLAANVVTKRVLGGQTTALSNNFKTRSDWEKSLLSESTFRLLKNKHPDIFDQVINAGWAAQQQGKNDGEITNAFRGKLIQNFPAILSAADDFVFERYVKLSLAQARAARNVSFDACYLFAQGQLNIQQNLPEQLWREELVILGAALESNETNVIITEPEADDLMSKVFSDLTEAEIQAIADPPKSSPIDVCNGAIKMFATMENMPTAEKVRAARYLYTSK